jgi:hypothetical protein
MITVPQLTAQGSCREIEGRFGSSRRRNWQLRCINAPSSAADTDCNAADLVFVRESLSAVRRSSMSVNGVPVDPERTFGLRVRNCIVARLGFP